MGSSHHNIMTSHLCLTYTSHCSGVVRASRHERSWKGRSPVAAPRASGTSSLALNAPSKKLSKIRRTLVCVRSFASSACGFHGGHGHGRPALSAIGWRGGKSRNSLRPMTAFVPGGIVERGCKGGCCGRQYLVCVFSLNMLFFSLNMTFPISLNKHVRM